MSTRKKSAKVVKAMRSPSVTVRDRRNRKGSEHEIELDKYVEDALEDAFGEDVDLRKLSLVITDADHLDDEAVKALSSDGGVDAEDLIALGELMDEHSDADLVAAALVAADGDVDYAGTLCENVAWVGGRNEDEEDYAYYVVEEGLMGDNLGNYFDYEAFGRDLMHDVHPVKVGRQIVVFNN